MNTANMKRHIGKLKNTDERCVIAFMQIPGKPTHALIISPDGLPPRFEQAVMEVLESPEGQADQTLANVLGRRMMPDTRQTILETLHNLGALRPVPVDNVIMYPVPNMPFPLRAVIEQMGGEVPAMPTTVDSPDAKFNPYVQAQQNDVTEASRGVAQNLIIEASMLEGDAKTLLATAAQKREAAYKVDPSLRPTVEVSAPDASAVKVEVTPKPRGRAKAKAV